MNTLFIEGGWYCDARVGGAFVVLVPDQHLVTDAGIVPLPPGGNLLYVRMAPDGIRFAGQGQRDDRAWEWDGGSWRDHGSAFGVSPVIYDNSGILRINPGAWGSQGARYVTPHNWVVTGDETYYSPAMELSEWSWIAPQLYVGQSHPDGTNDSAWIYDAGTRRLLEPGRCLFIRAVADGEQAAIAIWKPGQGALLGWPTLSELRSLPPVTWPAPIPEPEPEPDPMSLPDPSAVRAALEHERAKYPERVTNDQCGLIVRDAARQFPHCGQHRKTGGEFARLPTGETVNRNVMRYLPPGDAFGWWADVLAAAGAGIASPVAPDWQRSTDGPESFVPAGTAPAPEPEPEPEPEPGDLESRVAAIERWIRRPL